MEIIGINLGRCYNKYIIIEIFLFAAEEDAIEEAEAVLWIASRRHRRFLAKNFYWYPNILVFKLTPWASLKKKSKEIKSLKQARHIFDNIRIDGEREVKKVVRIYTASQDGWTAEDFHRHCDNNGPTLCVIRLSFNNYLAAGFKSESWTSPTFMKDVDDPSAMVF